MPRRIHIGVEAQAYLDAQGLTKTRELLDLLDEFVKDGEQALQEVPLDAHEAAIQADITIILGSMYEYVIRNTGERLIDWEAVTNAFLHIEAEDATPGAVAHAGRCVPFVAANYGRDARGGH